jgi:hypothetical protein
MIVTYTVNTPMIHDAREQAVRLAKAQGFSRVIVLSVQKIGPDKWEIKMQLFRKM